ncbi:hypothetical protein ACIA58_26165 [Kribbella sp. NPDC051586]|uniref:hypothetical protein n=1 Tax=Kribbella sp. NPDC051586 TaxID=3364118 RepID=UPI0037AFAF5A
MAFLAVLALPLAALAVLILVLRGRAWRTSVAEVGMVYGTVPWVWSSVDDVLLNTAGAGLAALASRRWWLTSSRQTPAEQSVRC